MFKKFFKTMKNIFIEPKSAFKADKKMSKIILASRFIISIIIGATSLIMTLNFKFIKQFIIEGAILSSIFIWNNY